MKLPEYIQQAIQAAKPAGPARSKNEPAAAEPEPKKDDPKQLSLF